MEDKKLCPVLMLNKQSLAASFCLEDECAWYIKPKKAQTYSYVNVLTGEPETVTTQAGSGECAILKLATKSKKQ